MPEFQLHTAVFTTGTRGRSRRTIQKAASRSQVTAKTVGVPQTRVSKASAKKTAATKASAKKTKKTDEPADIVVTNRETAESFAIEVKVKEGTGEVVVTVLSTEGEKRQPLAQELVRRGLELLFLRESRLERTAARYGLAAEALLASLEESAIDLTDESAGVPEAELQALREAGVNLEGPPSDPSGAAQVALGLARFQKFRDEALTVNEAANLLQVSDSRVRQLISSGDVVTIPSGDGHLLPAWQFAGGRLVPGLSALIGAIDDVHPLTVASFMTLPDVDLEVEGKPVSPVQWLLGGGSVETVVDLAAGLAIPS